MSKFISKTVQIVFVVLLSLIFVAYALSVGEMVSTGILGTIVTLILLFLCVLMICFGGKIFGRTRARIVILVSKLSTKQMVFIIGFITLLTKLFFLFLLDVDSTLHSDMQMYHSFANQIALNGEIVEYVSYATKHPYTAIYGLILSPFARLLGSDPKALTAVLSVAMSVASILLFDMIRQYTGKVIAFCGILFYNLLPVGLFQTQLLVHETALLFFGVLSLWFLLKSFDKKLHILFRVICLVVAGACIAVGLSINAAGKVILISLCIVSFVRIIGEKITLKKLLCTMCFFLVFAVSVVCVTNGLTVMVTGVINTENTSVFPIEKRLPYGWPVYLGLNYETSGHINKEDADTYHKYEGFDDPDEAKQYQKDLIKERLDEYISKPFKIPVHLFRKIKALWQGPWLPFPYAQGNAIEQFILTGGGGFLYKGMYMFNAMVFLWVLSMILLSEKNKKNASDNNLVNMHCKMVVIGVTLALLCFEITPKYASHLPILVYAIWMFQLKDFSDCSTMIHQKLVNIFNKKT